MLGPEAAGRSRPTFIALSLFTSLLLATTAGAYTEAELQAAEVTASEMQAATTYLADPSLDGREPGTPGSLLAQDYLISELSPVAGGAFPGTGDDAYKQIFDSGSKANIAGIIQGRELPGESIIVGAHYDHFGNGRLGATDNAAGVAIVLAIAKAIDSLPHPPRRSVVFAFWDAEEFGFQGSQHFANWAAPVLHLVRAYVNYDIQGANLLPSVHDMSFAIGAESGGAVLEEAVDDAIATQGLDTRQLSMIFGQDRSDHTQFYYRDVPSVFFSDGTTSCYHTTGDNVDVVDFVKLAEQSRTGFRLVVDLAEQTATPSFVSSPGVVYDDAVVVSDVLMGAVEDLSLFHHSAHGFITTQNAQLAQRVVEGPAAFDTLDQIATAASAEALLEDITAVDCDGFIPLPEPDVTVQYTALALLTVWLRGRKSRTGA